MTTGVEEKAAIEQLEEALRADDPDEKNFHVREAMQLLRVAEQTASTSAECANQTAE